MTTLVLQLPERPRLTGQAAPTAAPGFDWWLLQDDGGLRDEGHDRAEALPRADQLVLMLAETALSWHRITLPRTNAKRWRAALVGLLEESLLEDPEQLHLALEPQASGGAACWVAATALAPLREALAQLDAAQRIVDRIVPRSTPGDAVQAHVQLDAHGQPQLCWRGPEGVALLPLAGSLARTRGPQAEGVAWSASAEAQAAAEHWLGQPVALRSPQAQLAQALASGWDLRQFELAPRLHGMRWLRNAQQQLMHRRWRAARVGLVAWLGLSLVALNAAALQQRVLIKERQQQLERTLKEAFPRVSYVLQPALQMQRELGQLRAQAGELGDGDLEALVAALAQAWPLDRGPVEALQFEPGQLSLPRTGFSDAQIDPLRQQLASEGWQLDDAQGKLLLKRKTP